MESLVEDIFHRRQIHHEREQSDRRARVLSRQSLPNPVASNVNLECPREMFLRLTDPASLPDFDVETLARLAHGSLIGKVVRRMFEDWGLNVVHGESPIEIKDRKGRKCYTGMIDFGVQEEKTRRIVPVEVKSMSQYVFDSITTIEDLERKFWTKKYRRQILIYLLGRSIDDGILALYHRGYLKLLPIKLTDHLAEAEEALTTAELVLDAREAKAPPGFAKDPDTCRRCGFFGRACQPPLLDALPSLFVDDNFEAELQEYLDLKPARSRYEALDKRIKKRVLDAKVERAICGNVGIEVKPVTRKGYTVKESTYRTVSFVRTETVKVDEGAA